MQFKIAPVDPGDRQGPTACRRPCRCAATGRSAKSPELPPQRWRSGSGRGFRPACSREPVQPYIRDRCRREPGSPVADRRRCLRPGRSGACRRACRATKRLAHQSDRPTARPLRSYLMNQGALCSTFRQLLDVDIREVTLSTSPVWDRSPTTSSTLPTRSTIRSRRGL